jgi:hypothetical protein
MTTKHKTKRAASCSDVQQLVEKIMVNEFSRELGRELGRATIPIGKTRVTVDGFHSCESGLVLVEAWAHVGKVRKAQRDKVRGDLLKLALVTSVLRRSDPAMKIESYLLFADQTAARLLDGKGWPSLAAKEFGVTSRVIPLSVDVIETIKEAQCRQDIRITDE